MHKKTTITKSVQCKTLELCDYKISFKQTSFTLTHAVRQVVKNTLTLQNKKPGYIKEKKPHPC